MPILAVAAFDTFNHLARLIVTGNHSEDRQYGSTRICGRGRPTHTSPSKGGRDRWEFEETLPSIVSVRHPISIRYPMTGSVAQRTPAVTPPSRRSIIVLALLGIR